MTVALANPAACRDRFSAAAWQLFVHDVSFFRSRMSLRDWERAQLDHGFNGPPAWLLAGRLVCALPLSDASLLVLNLLDPILLLLALVLATATLGGQVTAVTILVLTTFYPAEFGWVGGSILRYDWLAALVIAVCLAARGRHGVAGVSLGVAAALRLFPVVALAGPLLAIVARGRPAEDKRRLGRLVLAGVATVCTLVAIPCLVDGPADSADFVANIRKHAETPLANNVGLPVALAYRPVQPGRNASTADPWQAWKEQRQRALAAARPAWAAVALAFLFLMARAVKRAAAWEALAIGLCAVAVCLPLTCYYYAFVCPLGFLAGRRSWIAPWLLGLCLASQVVRFWPASLADADRYALLSAVIVLALAGMLLRMGKPTALAAWPDVRLRDDGA